MNKVNIDELASAIADIERGIEEDIVIAANPRPAYTYDENTRSYVVIGTCDIVRFYQWERKVWRCDELNLEITGL